jgi:DNA-directed RNA polymerase specialized sigma24 family protein
LRCTCPDPVITFDDGSEPEHEALTAGAVGLALLVVLETLTPAERLAFVLHDLFGVPFTEIGPIVGRTPDAAKMLASRGRRNGRLVAVLGFTIAHGKIVAIDVLADPERLGRLGDVAG